MTTTWTMILLIAGCAAVTWIPRIIPFALVKNMTIPPVLMRWLAYIPVCILSALVIESLLVKEGRIVYLDWAYVFAFVPTFLIAVWTKSLSKTVIAGVLTMALLRAFL